MDRRSFLNLGGSGVLGNNDWDAFCHRLQRSVQGKLTELSRATENSYGVAEVCIERLEDIRHIHAYCQEYDVALGLVGFTSQECVKTRSLLLVRFSPRLNEIEYLNQDIALVQPSVRAGELLEVGFKQFTQVPEHITVAEWFSNPCYHDCRPYHSFLSGVERVNVLFADGSQAVLGGFGVEDRSALSVPILNRCIPQLFELLQEVRDSLGQAYWCYEYRLDALEKKWVDINLARVFLGQKARLVWAQQWVIRKIPEDVLLLPQDNKICEETAYINHKVKNLFDEGGIFPYDDELL